MMRNLKVLGLALVAVFAMSAVTASMASADDLTSEATPVTLTGAKDGEFIDEFLTTAGTVKCPEPTYHGTTATPTTSVLVTPDYEDKACTGFGFPATIDVNGCQYRFNINGAGSTEGTVDIICPEGKEITVTATAAGTTKCTVHVPSQNGLKTVKYLNAGGAGATREITVEVNLTNIKYSHTVGTGLGSCPSGSSTTGTLKAKALVKGEVDGGGAQVGIFLS